MYFCRLSEVPKSDENTLSIVMGAANVKQDKFNNLQLEGHDGTIIYLPKDLYDHLAPESDAFSSTKDFIGFVDKEMGVVIVDASTIIDEFNRCNEPQTPDNLAPELPGLVRSSSTNSLHKQEASSRKEDKKTMHQLAYERVTGRSLPSDDTRPISGFGIKNGNLLYNSNTFNAFCDNYHTSGREMSLVEMYKLDSLINKLKSEEITQTID